MRMSLVSLHLPPDCVNPALGEARRDPAGDEAQAANTEGGASAAAARDDLQVL